MTHVLFIADVIGSPGREALKAVLPTLRRMDGLYAQIKGGRIGELGVPAEAVLHAIGRVDVEHEIEPLVVGFQRVDVERLLEQFVQWKLDVLEAELMRLDFRQVENVV